MTARAIITESELRRMARVVKSEGVRVGTEIDGRVYWVAPEHSKPAAVDEQEEIRL
ncbi:hypothetical protein [Rhizobium sp. NFR03]|uniref:hypothetical protein n=1 Tax=Rhizobium sp. NFR03 TaxID=1566263 RepID=UPI0008D47851|nr:hypothetical protein [Rhizobium sp. NFR03]SER58517.1 hypothetical protein SAMN03159406_00577 [Rhizobium sp. NFR03]